jgi:hypothetical protein
MPRNDDVIDYRSKVEEAVNPQVAMAWALVGLAEELNAGTTEIAEAVSSGDFGQDIGGAIERGLDSAGRDIAQAIETGLSEIAKEVRGIGS